MSVPNDKERVCLSFHCNNFWRELFVCSLLKYFGQVLVGFYKTGTKKINQSLAGAILRFIGSIKHCYGAFLRK